MALRANKRRWSKVPIVAGLRIELVSPFAGLLDDAVEIVAERKVFVIDEAERLARLPMLAIDAGAVKLRCRTAHRQKAFDDARSDPIRVHDILPVYPYPASMKILAKKRALSCPNLARPWLAAITFGFYL
jgi:hypothetical protein